MQLNSFLHLLLSPLVRSLAHFLYSLLIPRLGYSFVRSFIPVFTQWLAYLLARLFAPSPGRLHMLTPTARSFARSSSLLELFIHVLGGQLRAE